MMSIAAGTNVPSRIMREIVPEAVCVSSVQPSEQPEDPAIGHESHVRAPRESGS